MHGDVGKYMYMYVGNYHIPATQVAVCDVTIPLFPQHDRIGGWPVTDLASESRVARLHVDRVYQSCLSKPLRELKDLNLLETDQSYCLLLIQSPNRYKKWLVLYV